MKRTHQIKKLVEKIIREEMNKSSATTEIYKQISVIYEIAEQLVLEFDQNEFPFKDRNMIKLQMERIIRAANEVISISKYD